MPKTPNTRFTRIRTDVLVQLRRYCRKSKAVASDVVSDAVTGYLKRAAGKAQRSKTVNT